MSKETIRFSGQRGNAFHSPGFMIGGLLDSLPHSLWHVVNEVVLNLSFVCRHQTGEIFSASYPGMLVCASLSGLIV